MSAVKSLPKTPSELERDVREMAGAICEADDGFWPTLDFEQRQRYIRLAKAVYDFLPDEEAKADSYDYGWQACADEVRAVIG